jgi:repressor LexA
MNLTPKQLHILTRIRDVRLTKGYSPTLQELADELSVSKVTIFEHVEALLKKGALCRTPNKSRSLDVPPGVELPNESRYTQLPLVGTIAAGRPIEAVEDRQTLDLDQIFSDHDTDPGDTFVLRVTGDSMIDEHIRDGDYVIVRRASTARNGQTVVALLNNGEATLKKLFRDKRGIRLQPANPLYEPIIVRDCKIQGIVVGVLRVYD